MSTVKKERKFDGRLQAHLEARTKIIKALAHPTRLFMVEELSQKERCVSELTEMIGSDVSTVSKHLSILKNAGIVQDQKRSSQVYYLLRVPCILKFFDCIEEVLEANVKAHIELVRPCCTL
ncbi:MAG: metalloregulator ArsR/SmtB family transcription factor [Thermodesulfobacteriota bacterium]